MIWIAFALALAWFGGIVMVAAFLRGSCQGADQ